MLPRRIKSAIHRRTRSRVCSCDISSRQFVEAPPAAFAPATQHAHNQRLDLVPLSLSGQRPPLNSVRVNALRGRTHPQGPCHSKRWHLSTYAIASVPFGTKAIIQVNERQPLAWQTVPRGVQSGTGTNEGARTSFDDRAPQERRRPTLPTGGSVPSARVSLTSLFGMGRGGTSPL